jgi:Skp family chaperone for outer membrane proteins
MFEESQWGRRALGEINADSAALAAENRRIEAELSAEEQDLADRRSTISAQEFRLLADAFDAKVVDIRRNQDTKLRDLNRLNDAERQAFFAAAAPILREYLLASEGAVAILDRRAILVASDAIDITDQAIALIDARVGAGERPAIPPEQN